MRTSRFEPGVNSVRIAAFDVLKCDEFIENLLLRVKEIGRREK
jgi:hypothetical protein